MTKLLRNFLRQSSHYSAGQFLVLLSSLISFPILTRVFSLTDYGVMNLLSNTVLIMVALSKGGLQHSIVRSYHEFARPEGPEQPKDFASTLLIGGLLLALVVTLFGALLSTSALQEWVEHPALAILVILSSGLIFFRAAESLLLAFLRAEEKTFALNGYRVIVRYLNLGMILVFLFFVSGTLKGFYFAQLLAMAIAVSVLFIQRMKLSPIRVSGYNGNLFRQALVYGSPLIGFELASMLLNYTDRYLLQYYQGAEAVGLYSAAYNLIDYVKDLVVVPLATAVMPIYMRIWSQKGPEATARFLRSALKSYALLAIPFAFGCAATGRSLLHIVASEKFIDGHVIIPWVIAGLIINGAVAIVGAGLYLQKRTNLLAGLLVFVTVLNVGANYLCIPKYGIEGAAMTKLLSYCVLAIFVTGITSRVLKLNLPWLVLLKYLAAGILMYFTIMLVQLSSPLMELVVRCVIGATVYGLTASLIEKGVRENIRQLVQQFSGN